METINLKITFVFLLLLGFLNAGYAQDSASIQVSCIMPEIPGVNVPLLEKETLVTKPELVQNQMTESDVTTNEPLPSIQEDASQEKVDSEGQTTLVMLKTFYTR